MHISGPRAGRGQPLHLLAVALLAHPSGELLFMLLDRMLTMLATAAVFLFDGGCAVAVLFI